MILALILLSLLSLASACPSSVSLDQSTCTFHFNYDPSCSSFDLLWCEWEECPGAAGNDCLQFSTKKSSNWTICTKICCDGSVPYPRNSDGLDQCQTDIKDRYLREIIAGILVPLGAFLVFFLCCCLCKSGCGKCLLFLKHTCKRLGMALIFIITCGCCHNQRVNIEPPKREDSCAELDINPNIFEPLWTSVMELNTKRATICCVCLDDKTSLSLQCGHSYHRQCILQCLKRKRQCILCRSTQINKAQVYCQICLSSSFPALLDDHMGSLDGRRQVCQTCTHYQNSI